MTSLMSSYHYLLHQPGYVVPATGLVRGVLGQGTEYTSISEDCAGRFWAKGWLGRGSSCPAAATSGGESRGWRNSDRRIARHVADRATALLKYGVEGVGTDRDRLGAELRQELLAKPAAVRA